MQWTQDPNSSDTYFIIVKLVSTGISFFFCVLFSPPAHSNNALHISALQILENDVISPPESLRCQLQLAQSVGFVHIHP